MDQPPEVAPTTAGRQAAFRFVFAAALMNAVSFGIMIPVLPNLIKHLVGGDTATASTWNVLFAVTWGVMQLFCGPVLEHALRPDRPAAGAADFAGRFGHRLPVHGLRAEPRLAVRRPGDQRHDRRELLDRQRLCGRRHRAQGPGQGLRLDGLSVQLRLPRRSGVRRVPGRRVHARLPRRLRASRAVPGGRWPHRHQLALRAHRPARRSLPVERRVAKFNWARANPLGSLAFLQAHGELLGLATVGFLFQLAHTVLPSIFVLYAGFRYHWGSDMVGLTMMLTGILGVVVQSFFVGPVVARIGERGALLLGTLGGAAGFTLYGLAPEEGGLGLHRLCAGLRCDELPAAGPPGAGMTRRAMGPQAQGQLQGANQSLQGIRLGHRADDLRADLRLGGARRRGSAHARPAAIFIAAGLLVCAFLLAVRVGHAPASIATAATE